MLAAVLGYLLSALSQLLQAIGPAVVQAVQERINTPDTAVTAEPDADLNAQLDASINSDIAAGDAPPLVL